LSTSPQARSGRFLCAFRAALLACACAAALAAAPAPEQATEAPGADAPSALDQELQALIDQMQALSPQIMEQQRRLLRESPDLFALAMLKIEKADICLGQPAKSETVSRRARDNLREAVALWKPLVEGRRPELPQHGLLERAYLAGSDMSPQPYALYVPESYDGEEPYGLFVFLHGYTPDLNKVNWLDLMYSPANETLAQQTGCIVLLPFGRGNTDFQGAGEDDVLRAIREVQEHYNIDEDRVFLSGISMGGMGVWTIGAHNPHLFAALIPIASRGDFYMWKGIRRGSLPDWKAKLVDAEFGAELVPNYGNLPCVIVHGTGDWVMPIEQSERMHALLGAAGVESTFVRVAEATHYTWDKLLLAPEVLDCLKHTRRRAEPRKVEFRTYSLKHARAYWAEVTGIEDWDEPAEVTCELTEAGDALSVHTRNVSALRLRPPAGETPLRITWNGAAAEPVRADDGALVLHAGAQAEAPLEKRRGLCGPIREAYAAPFLIVLGGPSQDDAFRAAMQAAVDWVTYAQGMPSIVECAAVSENLIERCNLILFGTPEDNELIARIAPDLPIELGDGHYRIGERTYDAASYGLSMVYPNPLAPDRYVVVNSGPVWGADLPVNHKYDMLPDFIVFTQAVAQDGTLSNEAVCAGFFDQRWQLSEASTWHAPTPEREGPAPAADQADAPSE